MENVVIVRYEHGSKQCYIITEPAAMATAERMRSLGKLFEGIAQTMETAQANPLLSAGEIKQRLDAAVASGMLIKTDETHYRMPDEPESAVHGTLKGAGDE